MTIPKIIQQPTTHTAMQSGITKIVNAISPTLGPLPHYLVHIQDNKFELLDDGGIIARRIVQINNRGEDVGAMLLRQVLWQVNQQVGDGTATTAVLYESIYNEGLRSIAAGANPMQLRDHLMDAVSHLVTSLMAQCSPITDVQQLKAVAHSICYDQELANRLGDIFDTVGQYGQIDVRKGNGRGVEHKFVEGFYVKGNVQSKEMLRGTARHVAELYNPAILTTDMDIEEPSDLVALMQLAIRLKIENLLLIVNNISDKALSVVLDKRVTDKIKVVVVKIDSFIQDDLIQAREDITKLVGGNPIIKAAGQTLDHVQESDFGAARWVWADNNHFGFAGGQGDAYQIREHITTLRDAYCNVTDDSQKQRLLSRLGRLYGGSATVYVGGITNDDIEARKLLAERSVRAVRQAMAGGVIPGGGTTLYNCRDMLLSHAQKQTTFEGQAAYQILAKAVEAPIRTILTNAGQDASEILAQLQHCAPCYGFNSLKQEIVNVIEDGILDIAHIQKEAIVRAVSGAAQALTIDVMVLHRNPETRVEP